jgi:hypothetical protein
LLVVDDTVCREDETEGSGDGDDEVDEACAGEDVGEDGDCSGNKMAKPWKPKFKEFTSTKLIILYLKMIYFIPGIEEHRCFVDSRGLRMPSQEKTCYQNLKNWQAIQTSFREKLAQTLDR